MAYTWDGSEAEPQHMSASSQRKKPGYTDCDVVISSGSVTDLHPIINTEGAKEISVIIRNRHATRSVVCSIMAAGVTTPAAVHDGSEWEQKPDSTTTYTVGPQATKRVNLKGPINGVKVRGISDGAAFADSVDVHAEQQM